MAVRWALVSRAGLVTSAAGIDANGTARGHKAEEARLDSYSTSNESE
jgi:hypothetical protein